MSEMMVLGFENELEADRFGLKLAELQKDMIVQLGDAAEVVRDPDGKPHVKHGDHLVGAGAMGGAFWGMLFGLLFFMPFLGMAIGAGMGALFGKMGKTGIQQRVLEQMGDAIPPGKAGWFLIITQITEDKFLAAIEKATADVNSEPAKWDSLLSDKKLVPAPLIGKYVLPKFPAASVPSEAQLKDVMAWMIARGLIKQEVPYGQLVDASYLPK